MIAMLEVMSEASPVGLDSLVVEVTVTVVMAADSVVSFKMSLRSCAKSVTVE